MSRFSRGQVAQITKRVRKSGLQRPEDFERGTCPIDGHDFHGAFCTHTLPQVREAIELVLAKVS